MWTGAEITGLQRGAGIPLGSDIPLSQFWTRAPGGPAWLKVMLPLVAICKPGGCAAASALKPHAAALHSIKYRRGSYLLPKSRTLPSSRCSLLPLCLSGAGMLLLQLEKSCSVLPWRGLVFSAECSSLTLSCKNVSLYVNSKLLQKSLNATTNQRLLSEWWFI